MNTQQYIPNLTRLFCLLLAIFLMIACQKDEVAPTVVAELKLEYTNYTLKSGESPMVDIKIVSGNGFYAVTSSDEAVARVFKNGENLAIAAFKSGTTTIKVTDRQNKEATLQFTVAPNYVPGIAPDKLVQVKTGTVKSLAVPPFSSSFKIYQFNNAVANVTMAKDTLVANGLAPGISYVWVTNQDGFLAKSYCIQTVSKYKLELLYDQTNIYYKGDLLILIKSGSGNYTVTVADPTLLSAGQYRYTPADKIIEPQLNNPVYLLLTSLRLSSTPTFVIIRDNETSDEIKLNLQTIPAP